MISIPEIVCGVILAIILVVGIMVQVMSLFGLILNKDREVEQNGTRG